MGLFSRKKREEFMMPISGKIIELENVQDPVFSQGIMGTGLAVEINEPEVIAPISGKVTSIFPTGHALTIEGTNGINVLIHIGLDSVNLKDGTFEKMVNVDDMVNQGDLLIKVNLDSFKEAKVATTCPIIFLDKQVITICKNESVKGDTKTIKID